MQPKDKMRKGKESRGLVSKLVVWTEVRQVVACQPYSEGRTTSRKPVAAVGDDSRLVF